MTSPGEQDLRHPGAQAGAPLPVARPVCRLKRGVGRRAERGHLWVFSNEIEGFDRQPENGDEVVVRDARGHWLGVGLYSHAALIAVRIYSREIRSFDTTLLRERLEAARAHRIREWGAEPDACRVCFSEGDLLPGLIVDRYGDHVVFQILTSGMERRRDMILEALEDLFHPACLYERSDVSTRGFEGLPERAECVRGQVNPHLTVRLDEVVMGVDVAGGQKTGLFLDQVGNWRRARERAKGRRVLDCFCYQGGWSLAAARGGAVDCLGIDTSPAALETATKNAERNGLEAICRFERAEVFEALRGFEQAGRTFDLIVLDPPAFAKNRKQVKAAERGYRDLNLRALRLLPPGGLLFTCSCSYHITPDVFDEILVLAARDAGKIVRVLPGTGQGIDHPVLLSTPETLYLKVKTLEVVG